MGSTAPSVPGPETCWNATAVASGPVSASPSPTTHATDEIGVVEHRPERVTERVTQLAALMDRTGHSGDAWLGIPPGNEKLKKQLSAVRLILA